MKPYPHPYFENKVVNINDANKDIFGILWNFLSPKDIENILNMRWEKQQELMKEAQKTRNQYLWDTVSVRGVIEISNLCNKNCDYCSMSVVNKKIERYNMTSDEIFEIAKQIEKAWIQTLFIQSGEDKSTDDQMIEAIKKIRNNLSIKNIILNCWNRTKQEYESFKNTWVDWYILKFETSDENHFKSIRHDSLAKRIQCIQEIRDVWLKIWTGNITWLPLQNMENLAQDILLAYNIHPNYISTAPFIPNEWTPFEKELPGSVDIALNTIALLRIILKDVSIPTVSAFEKSIKWGQKMWFDAWANVITINFTPKREQWKYKIYSDWRFVVSMEHAIKTIEEAWLESDIVKHTNIRKWDKNYKENLENLPWCIDTIPTWFSDVVTKIEPWEALDLGCWVWNYSNFLQKNWFQTTWVDFSQEALNIAKQKFWSDSGIKFIESDVLHLDKTKEYNLVCDISLFHHIKPEDRKEYLNKLFDLTRKGWTIILSCFDSKDERFNGQTVFYNEETDTTMYPLNENEINNLFWKFDYEVQKIGHWKNNRKRFLFVMKPKKE